MKKLSECDHPYYMEDSCYFASAGNSTHESFSSWDDYLAGWGSADVDRNHIFRFDWKSVSEDEERSIPEVHIFYIMQRKAYPFSVSVKVTDADEERVRAYFVEKWEHVKKLWAPISEVEHEG